MVAKNKPKRRRKSEDLFQDNHEQQDRSGNYPFCLSFAKFKGDRIERQREKRKGENG
jgi:hypothetical protein